MKLSVITILLLFVFTGTKANQGLHQLLTNVPNRTTVSLNGQWDYIIDPYETGYYDYRLNPSRWGFFRDDVAVKEGDLVEYNFEESPEMYLPHDWNTADEQLKYYEGTVWFRKAFNFTKEDQKRYFLYFGAVNYEAVVYLNGELLGRHKGGFTPFNFEVSDKIKDGLNKVIVKVDNKRHRDEVPTVNTDWWNYGGITRDVMLIEEESTFIADYSISLEGTNRKLISGWVKLDGEARPEISIELPELKKKLTLQANDEGIAAFSLKAAPELWSPENPKLYKLVLSTPESSMEDEIAFRTIETKGNQILLNGEPVFLRGICLHEEAPFRQGRFNTREEAHTLLSWAKEMNSNFVRLAHYPHNEHMVREAERMGFLVWSEIPVYWTISFDNEETLQNAKNQLNEMITRDRNRGSVIIWSLANETPHSDIRNQFLTKMVDHARSLDDSRLISMAMEKQYRDNYTPVIDDPLMGIVDVVSFNTYIGWYDGTPEKCSRMNWIIPDDKPVVISEFGGGALQGYHGKPTQRWTEEYQEELYRQSVGMFDKMELAGTAPWIMMDFLSPRRLLPGIQDGFNRKGLVSNMGVKKKAFFIMRDWYEQKK